MKRNLLLISTIFVLVPTLIFGQQIENPGFENWENAGTVKDEPVDWSTIKTCDDPSIASVAPVTFDQSTDAHTGNYSLKLYNVLVFGISATGAITNGRFHAEFDLDSSYSYTDPTDPKWCTPFTAKPDSLVGWFKFFPQENDAAQFKVILHVDEAKLPANGTSPNWVAMAVYVTPQGQTFDSWTRFSVPFEYFDNRTPEYLFVVLNSGDSTQSVPDSYLLVDDLELIYPQSGISEHRIAQDFLVQDKRAFTINLSSEGEYMNCRFDLLGIAGQAVYTTRINGSTFSLPENIKPGVYVATLEGKTGRYVQKVMIQ